MWHNQSRAIRIRGALQPRSNRARAWDRRGARMASLPVISRSAMNPFMNRDDPKRSIGPADLGGNRSRGAARWLIALVAAVAMASPGSARMPPAGIARQVPAGFKVLASARMAAGHRIFEIVALGHRSESGRRSGAAPARPLLVFEQKGGGFVLAGRNDHVVMKADEGGQCDPFLDGGATIATKGRYFTVQNGVACGQHWTDYVTFRLDDRIGAFVLDNERFESWSMNADTSPDAEAMVRDAPPRITRDGPGRFTLFTRWRPR